MSNYLKQANQESLKIPEKKKGNKEMASDKPVWIKVSIFPWQLEWIEKIAKLQKQPKKQIFYECFSMYIRNFKEMFRKAGEKIE